MVQLRGGMDTAVVCERRMSIKNAIQRANSHSQNTSHRDVWMSNPADVSITYCMFPIQAILPTQHSDLYGRLAIVYERLPEWKTHRRIYSYVVRRAVKLARIKVRLRPYPDDL